MSRKLFVNLPVRDLPASKAFFGKLGFEFNPKFSDDNGACMVLGNEGYVMLLTEPFFKTFTERAICDGKSQVEALFTLSCESRAEVDELVNKALAAGATPGMPSHDHGFMYGWGFHDLDGHAWGLMWMDPAATV